jgi:hypothetical protein
LPPSFGIVDLSSEKKATSHPEVRADNIRKIKIKIIFTITEIYNKKLWIEIQKYS